MKISCFCLIGLKMVFYFTWTIQVLILGAMALVFPYRESNASGFWRTRLFVLGIGIRPFERWKILLAVSFLWLGPWGMAQILHSYV